MTTQAQLDAIIYGAAFAPIIDRGFLRITGPDATRWLNGMVTNNIKDLKPGEGNYNFLLNAQGRIQADCTIYREPGEGDPTFLLETDSTQLETVHQTLDKFIIMDDVELAPVYADRQGLLLLGPRAEEVMELLDLPAVDMLHMAQAGTPNRPALVLSPYSFTSIRFEIFTDPISFEVVRNHLADAVGANEVSPEALEQARILEALPRYGQDIRDRDLPQETSQTQALHFGKGCYLGQEIVERIHSRGNVHRSFKLFHLQPQDAALTPPQLPAPLECNGKPAGELTSAAPITRFGETTLYALGYVRSEALQSGQPITYAGGTAIPGFKSSNLEPVTES